MLKLENILTILICVLVIGLVIPITFSSNSSSFFSFFGVISDGQGNYIIAKSENATLNFTHGSNIITNFYPLNNTIWIDAVNQNSNGQTYDTITNNGTGYGWYIGNTTKTHFNFKTLICGTNLSCANNTNDITINANTQGGTGATYDTMQNVGIGQASVYAGNSSKTNFQFKQLKATGSSTSLINDTQLITIYTKTYQNNTGSNLGTHGTGIYNATSSIGILQFLSLLCSSSNCSFSNNGTNVILSTVDTNTAQVVSVGTGTSLISSKDNATKTSLRSLANLTGYINWNHNSLTITPSFLFKMNSKTCGANQFVNILSNSSDSTCATPTVSGGATSLDSNVTAANIAAYSNVFKIALTANSGNTIDGILVATSNTAGSALQVGANLTTTHGQGWCNYVTPLTATTEALNYLVLSTVTSDTGQTTWLPAVNVPQPIQFRCTIVTDASPPSLWINIQPEVASTVTAKAGSYYIKTP